MLAPLRFLWASFWLLWPTQGQAFRNSSAEKSAKKAQKKLQTRLQLFVHFKLLLCLPFSLLWNPFRLDVGSFGLPWDSFWLLWPTQGQAYRNSSAEKSVKEAPKKLQTRLQLFRALQTPFATRFGRDLGQCFDAILRICEPPFRLPCIEGTFFCHLYSSPRYHNKAVRVLCWDNFENTC